MTDAPISALDVDLETEALKRQFRTHAENARDSARTAATLGMSGDAAMWGRLAEKNDRIADLLAAHDETRTALAEQTELLVATRADLARLRVALRALSEKWKHPPEGSDSSQYWVGKRTAYVLAAHELDGLLPPVPIVDIERPAPDTGEDGSHG